MAARMPQLRRVLVLFLLLSLRLRAQAPSQSPYSETANPTPERIAALLRSGDPRDRAWGAFHAVRTKDASFLPDLTGLAERWQPLPRPSAENPSPKLDAHQQDELDSMAAVLDGVIQFKGRLSPKVLLALASNFPAQETILLSRLSPAEAEPVALALFDDPYPPNSIQIRVAASMLALRSPPTFAAKLMHDLTIHAVVFVISPGNGGMGRGSSHDCGVGTGVTDKPDWPTVGQYMLQEYVNEKAESITVVAGRHPIHAVRLPNRSMIPATSCGGLSPLTPELRLELLAQMLGLTNRDLRVTAELVTNIHAADAAEYVKGLQLYVGPVLDNFQRLELILGSRNFVSPEELADGAAEPKLELELVDGRSETLEDGKSGRDFPLPKIAFSTGRVVWHGL